MNQLNQQSLRDPADLRLHPLLKKFIAEPDRASLEWQSFVDGLSAAGPDGTPEIFITADGQIMEGGRRWRAARQLGWTEMRCRVRPEDEAGALIVESLLGQRNMQRCAKVYIAITLLDSFVNSAERRRLQHLKAGVKTLEKPLSARQDGSLRDLADKFGVSVETVRRAKQVAELFAQQPALKAEWEPRLLTGDKSLWNVLSAVGGAAADQSRRTAGVEQSSLDYYSSVFAPLTQKAPQWSRLPEEKQERIIAAWSAEARQWKPELREAVIRAIRNA